MAHSLGGIVVKKALVDSEVDRDPINRRMIERTRYILFLGTPHRGASVADWGTILANLATVTLQDVDKNVLRALSTNSEILENIQRAFRRILDDQKVRIHSFQEERGLSGMKGLSNKVVANDSSKMESSYETVETIDANHMEMARYATRDDDGYNKVFRALRLYLKELNASSSDCGAGCGKSVTASVITRKLRQTYKNESTSSSRTFVSIAYIFKNDETKRDALSILRTFAWHLVRDSSLRPEVKVQIVHHWRLGEPAVEYNTHTREDELSQALVQLLRDALGGRRAYLVVDGLDECHNPYQAAQTLVEAIEIISENCEVRALIVSQKLPDLSSILSEKFICIDLHERDTRSKCEEDLDRILSSAMQQIEIPLIFDNYAAIKAKLRQKADGVVLWAALALGNIAKMAESSNQDDQAFLLTIEDLPSQGIEDMYKHLIRRIEDNLAQKNDHGGLQVVKNILSWTLWAARSLKVGELCVALLFGEQAKSSSAQADVHTYLKGAMTRLRHQINQLCYPLLRIQQDDTVAIAHSTFKDCMANLDSNAPDAGLLLPGLSSAAASRMISQCCLSYLTQRKFEDYSSVIKDDFNAKDFDVEHVFYTYAASYLKTHGVQVAPTIVDVNDDLANKFYYLINHKTGITWISRIFSDGSLSYRQDGLQWSLNLGLAKACKKDWLLDLLKTAIELYKETTFEVSLAQVSMMTYLASLLKSQGSYDKAEIVYQDILALQESTAIQDEQLTYTKSNLGMTLSEHGQLSKAEVLLQETLSARKSKEGSDSRNTLIAQNNLACCYQDQRRYDEAVKLFKDTAQREAQQLGRSNSSTICTYSNLANCLVHCGRFQEARAILEDNLVILRTGRYGEPLVLNCMSGLACMYDSMNEMQKAEDLNREVWARRLVIYGESHIDTIMGLNNLAFSCAQQSKYQDAEDLYKKALDLSTRAFGFQNQKTLLIAGSYADTLWALDKRKEAAQLRQGIYQAMNSLRFEERDEVHFALHAARLAPHHQEAYDWREAERLQVEALKIQCKKLGQEHYETSLSMCALADNCRERDLLRAALELYERAHAIERSTFGDHSTNITNTLSSKGEVLHTLGHYARARTAMQEALNIGETVLGPQHLSHIVAKGFFAALLADLGELEEANRLLAEVLNHLVTQYGRANPKVLFFQSNRALVYEKMGNLDEAILLHEDTLKICMEQLGDSSLLTAASRCHLAHAYQEKGLLTKAFDLAKPALKFRAEILGSKRRITLVSEHGIGLIYMKLGHYSEAEMHYLSAVNERFRLFGLAHIQTLDVLHDLAILYERLERGKESLYLLHYATRYRSDVLGSQHQDTINSEKALQSLSRKMQADPSIRASDIHQCLPKGLEFDLQAELKKFDKLNRGNGASRTGIDRVEELMRTVEEMSIVLGADFPLTLDVSSCLAIELAALGRQQEALPLFEKAWQGQYAKSSVPTTRAATFLVDYVKCLKATAKLIEELSGSLKHALTVAVQTENIPLFKLLMHAKADSNVPDESGSTPLIHAAMLGSKGERMTSELLKVGGKQIARNDGQTPLLIAFERSCDGIFELLLENGGDHESCLSEGEPLLYQASILERLRCVNALLDAGADPARASSEGFQPLHAATFKGNVDMMGALVRAGASPNAETVGTGFTPIHLASEFNHERALQYLLSLGANPNSLSASGFAPIYIAIEKGNIGTMKQLLDAGVDIEQVSQDLVQSRPLHFAAQFGDAEIVRELLDRKVNVDGAQGNGTTALHIACEAGKSAVVRLLLDAGADANVKNETGSTPFYCAALSGQVDKLELLLKKGQADPYILKSAGFSALHAAALNGHAGAIDFILSHTRIDPNIQTSSDSNTPLHFAAEAGHTLVVETLLFKWNANPDIQAKKGHTPLHFAVAKTQFSAVQTLLNHNPRLADIGENDHMTPLHYAAITNNPPIIDALINAGADASPRMIGNLTASHLAIWKHATSALSSLLRHGANPSEIDCFGMNLADYIACNYVDPADLPKWTRRVKPTIPESRQEVVRKSIRDLTQFLLDDLTWAPCSDAAGILGRCFLRLGRKEDARCAFQLCVTTNSEEVDCSEKVEYSTTCELCEPTQEKKEVRWVCEVCPDYDLCGNCRGAFEKGEVGEDKLEGCVGRGHEWFQIEGVVWVWSDEQEGKAGKGEWRNWRGEGVERWLRRMRSEGEEC
ncbi:MAG: hypothetical protein Q9225_001536 [Loekoesia sp. 1 TL-2023]